jgi:hypothetical protein
MNINTILARPENKGCSIRGASLGRSARFGEPGKVRLQKVRLSGDYDSGGAYWGNTPGTDIYCAFSEDTRVFCRASSRDAAKQKLMDVLQEKSGNFGWSFYR